MPFSSVPGQEGTAPNSRDVQLTVGHAEKMVEVSRSSGNLPEVTEGPTSAPHAVPSNFSLSGGI
jgi:hypothetical protein